MEQRFTAKGQATRQRIVEGAAAEIREHGATETTLETICHRTATSKSQLFHYFPDGKEQLLLAVAEHEAQRILDDQQPYLDGLTSWAAWSDWRDAVVERYRRQGPRCPLGILVSQLVPSTPGARAITSQLLAEWQGRLTAGIRSMQEHNEISRDLDAEHASAALLAGVQGGVTILLSTGGLTHLEAALDFTIAQLRAHSVPQPDRAAPTGPVPGSPARSGAEPPDLPPAGG